MRFGAQRRKKSDSNHFFTACHKEQKSDSNHFCDVVSREDKKVIQITFWSWHTENK